MRGDKVNLKKYINKRKLEMLTETSKMEKMRGQLTAQLQQVQARLTRNDVELSVLEKLETELGG